VVPFGAAEFAGALQVFGQRGSIQPFSASRVMTSRSLKGRPRSASADHVIAHFDRRFPGADHVQRGRVLAREVADEGGRVLFVFFAGARQQRSMVAGLADQ
jgi:hypothetical protein